MRGIFNVFWFTFREQVRKKSFIVSTVIIYFLAVAAICVPAIINTVKSPAPKSSAATSEGTVYVIDSENIISNNINEMNSSLGGYKFVIRQPSEKASLMNTIKDNSDKSLVVLSLKNGSPSFDFYVKNSTNGPDGDQISLAIKKIYGEALLKQGGVSQELINKTSTDVSYTSSTLGRGTISGVIASYLVVIILFFTIYMYGYWVAMSIASEKTSRVMEVLITSTKPSRIIIGKSIGMGILGLSQLLGLILVSAVTYFAVYPKNFEIAGTAINLSCFSPLAVLMMILYFIFGFSLYAMIYAVCGATVSKAEDIKQAMTPVSLIAVISFYFAYMTTIMPDGAGARLASLIPFSSPFAMPSRILTASVPAWEILLSLALLAATTALMCYISIKLYSSAVLHYGKRLKISELVRMSKAK